MRNFLIRCINVAAIAAIILVYNNYAYVRAEKVEAYEEKKAEYEQAMAELEADSAEDERKTGIQAEDGVYTGSGQGFGGAIEAEVTVSDGEITKIEILSAEKEDDAYFNQASAVIDKILSSQNTQVDTVSGATFSSNGIIQAVEKALEGEA